VPRPMQTTSSEAYLSLRTLRGVHATVADAPYDNDLAQVVELRWGRITGLSMHEDTQKLAATLARLYAAGVPEAAAPPIQDPGIPTSPTTPAPAPRP
jgi:hypothetical protein